MQLPLQDFATLVKTQAAAVATSCSQLVDLTVGSVLRALLEANASIGLWIQWLIVQVLAATRAATSNGVDLDSWVADFGMTRLPATAATGTVRFFRTTSGLAADIPAGALIRTGLSTVDQVFTVIADTANPLWTGTGYQLGATDLSVTARVVAVASGSLGNVVANTITMLATAIPGIDGVNNDSAMTGGVDAETDSALRTRFAGFLDSRNRATAQAVGFAISNVQQGLSYTIAERVDPAGVDRPGHFTVTVDDGSGSPAATLITQVENAINSVRPIGGTFSVRPPLIIPVSVGLRVTGGPASAKNVQAALITYIGAMPIGTALTITRLYQVAYGSDSSISNVSNATINGSEIDLVPPTFGLLRPSAMSVLS